MSLQFAFTDPSGPAQSWRQKMGYFPETPSSRKAKFSTNGKIYIWGTRFTHEPIAQSGIQGYAFGQYTSDAYYKKYQLHPYINDRLTHINLLATEGTNPNPIAGSNAITNSLISPGGNPLTWSALDDIDLYYRFRDNPYRPGDPLSPQYALMMAKKIRGEDYSNDERQKRLKAPTDTVGIQSKRAKYGTRRKNISLNKNRNDLHRFDDIDDATRADYAHATQADVDGFLARRTDPDYDLIGMGGYGGGPPGGGTPGRDPFDNMNHDFTPGGLVSALADSSHVAGDYDDAGILDYGTYGYNNQNGPMSLNDLSLPDLTMTGYAPLSFTGQVTDNPSDDTFETRVAFTANQLYRLVKEYAPEEASRMYQGSTELAPPKKHINKYGGAEVEKNIFDPNYASHEFISPSGTNVTFHDLHPIYSKTTTLELMLNRLSVSNYEAHKFVTGPDFLNSALADRDFTYTSGNEKADEFAALYGDIMFHLLNDAKMELIRNDKRSEGGTRRMNQLMDNSDSKGTRLHQIYYELQHWGVNVHAYLKNEQTRQLLGQHYATNNPISVEAEALALASNDQRHMGGQNILVSQNPEAFADPMTMSLAAPGSEARIKSGIEANVIEGDAVTKLNSLSAYIHGSGLVDTSFYSDHKQPGQQRSPILPSDIGYTSNVARNLFQNAENTEQQLARLSGGGTTVNTPGGSKYKAPFSNLGRTYTPAPRKQIIQTAAEKREENRQAKKRKPESES